MLVAKPIFLFSRQNNVYRDKTVNTTLRIIDNHLPIFFEISAKREGVEVMFPVKQSSHSLQKLSNSPPGRGGFSIDNSY